MPGGPMGEEARPRTFGDMQTTTLPRPAHEDTDQEGPPTDIGDPATQEPVRTTPGSSGNARPRVLLATEGTYPHFRGGVSTWCDFLIGGSQDVDFVVWTLMMNPFIKQQYELHPNVVNFVGVPLWGVEQPSEYTREIPSGKVFEASRRTREADIERHFVPLFERLIDSITAPLFDPDEFAGVLVEMHAYFREWDYRTTWRSRVVWEAFKRRLMAPTGLELPATEYQPDRGLLPSWSELKDSFGHLVRAETPNGQAPPEEGPETEVPSVGDAMEGLRWLYRLLQTLNIEVPRTDVTHSAAAAFCAIPCILAKAEHGTPFLLTEHGVYLREQYLNIERRRFPYNLKRFLIDLVSAVVQTSYALADQVSPVCAFNGRWETAYGADPDRIQVIYNGVSPERYRPMDVDRPSAPTVVQLGRIDPLKDLETFLRVADVVRREIPDVRFEHWGSISDDEYWEDVQLLHRELDLEETVTFKGYTSDPTAAYNRGDVVFLSSISEAFPYGVVEALMCGKPVVSTAVGGVPEALDGTGRTAATRDVDALADAVIETLRLPADEQERLSTEARQRALDNFTLDRFIGDYRDAYHHLATLRPAPAVPAPEDAPTTEVVRPALPAGTATIEREAPPERTAPAEPTAPAADVSVAELTEILEDPAEDPFARMRAIARVRAEPGVEAVLVGALRDDYPRVRREAVRALGRVGGTRAAQALADAAGADPSSEVRQEAVSALGPLLGNESGAGA